jgi:hypothetical protein
LRGLLLTELVVALNSRLIGKPSSPPLSGYVPRQALALRHSGQLFNTGFATRAQGAATPFCGSPRENYEALKSNNNFVIVSDIETKPQYRKSNSSRAGSSSSRRRPRGRSAMCRSWSARSSARFCCGGRCITLEEAYDAIELESHLSSGRA